MLAVTDIQTEEEVNDLKRVLLKCKECNLIGSLKNFVKRPDGHYNEMVIRQDSFKAKFLVNINDIDGGWVYLDIITRRKADIKQVRSLWDTVIRRGTQNALKRKPNDYRLVIDLIADELQNNVVYLMSFLQPIFISDEGNTMNNTGSYLFRMVFPISNVFFGIEEVTPDELEYEMNSDTSVDINSDNDDTLQNDTDETDEVVENFIDTNKYLQ